MRELLREKGYKATPARLAILQVFSTTKKPLNAEAVCEKLHREGKKGINEVTVYRTLAHLEKGGILREVNLRKDSVFYELNNDHHHHIVCTNCETVEKFENKDLEKVLGRIALKLSKFKSIKEHSLEIFGLCRVCS
ncbi:MAG: Ferric uptake regulator, Fur family [Candidatus Nomurabacteria bacterium GW2011_GWB1_47_6]|uniref:Ferric uptake regulator, Fur family n=1 Tax=Candidatus Nomurabacteria bacterium GW2011_GWB1_47_6 TaxID=1618749 RepID=A0A0G1SXN0_9BACT|nr:MAG: Ferric uptake regulator, Fur family [Candidatus Nomurabacteria bacterium GW2011_GWB1_47_6]